MILKRRRERVGRALLVCALCLLMLLSAQTAASAADGGASIVVQSDQQEYGLLDESLLVDLYYVGSPAGGAFQAVSPFGSSLLKWESNEELEELSNTMAGIAFNGAEPLVSGHPSGELIDCDDEGAPLPGGLYLVVARGVGLEDYVQSILADGKERYVTLAETEEYSFLFLPVLVVLTPDAEEPLVFTAKSTVAERFGDLEIVKLVERYENSEEAIFVFDIVAWRDGEIVYTNVASITWPTQDRAVISGIPAGAVVTVTEIYSGAHYVLVSDPDQTVVIQADGLVTVSFTNDYDGTGVGGHGIENRFTYVEEQNGRRTTERWAWSGEGDKK